MGLPQPVLPKGIGHTSDSASTTPRTSGGANKRGTGPVLTGRPVCWNQPAPTRSPEGITLGSAHRGRAAIRMEWPLEEKKRRSSCRPRGEADPKHGQSSGAEPSWDISKVGGQQSDRARSQPASEPEAPAPTSKLKSVVKSVSLNLPKPEDFGKPGPSCSEQI